MKPAITCDLILTSVSSRADGSLGLRFATPELEAVEKTRFFELQNCQLKGVFQPREDVISELREVKGQFDQHTPSQRLRAVLFVAFKQAKVSGEFEDYYRRAMEAFINSVKERLQPT